MPGVLPLLPWLVLAIIGIFVMQWGANRFCGVIGQIRGRFGLPAAAGAAFLGLATASPEISVNVVSVAFGWPDLGLGAALGSNVPALPLAFALSFLATRFPKRPAVAGTPPPPRVQPEAVPVQVVPYLLVLALLAVLTLPPPWAGLQPIDGAILVGAFALYMVHVFRQHERGEGAPVETRALARALVGLPAIALGALAAVTAARRLTDAFGISDLVGGLFIIGLLCALPEAFSAWNFTREGKPTTAVSGAMADGVVSLTLALVPPALAGAAVGNVTVYALNLAFLFAVLGVYWALNRRRGQELGLGRVSLYLGGYGAYLVATVLVLRG